MRPIDFAGKTRLYIEDGKMRVALSGGILAEPARLSTSLTNVVGRSLLRQMRHSALMSAGFHPEDFDLVDDSIDISGPGWQIFLHQQELPKQVLDFVQSLTPGVRNQTVIKVDLAMPTDLSLANRKSALDDARKALTALEWQDLPRVYANEDSMELELAMNPALVPEPNGTYAIPSLRPKLRYVPLLESVVLQTEQVQDALTVHNLLDTLNGQSEHSMGLIVIATAVTQEDRHELMALESVTLIEQQAKMVSISADDQTFTASWNRVGNRITLSSGVIRGEGFRRKASGKEMQEQTILLNRISRSSSPNGGGMRYYVQDEEVADATTSAELTKDLLLAHKPVPLSELNAQFEGDPYYAQVLLSLLTSGELVLTDGVVQLG